MAKKLNVSKHAVWRFLRAKGINLARKRSWCVSIDPEFATKAADVVGLYLSPPENAFVLCIDEKPKKESIILRRSFTQELPKLLRTIRFEHNKKTAYKRKQARKRIRTIAGALVREIC